MSPRTLMADSERPDLARRIIDSHCEQIRRMEHWRKGYPDAPPATAT